VRHDQVAVFKIDRAGAVKDLERRDLGAGVLHRTYRFREVDDGRIEIHLVAHEHPLHGAVKPLVCRLGRLFPDEFTFHPVVVFHAVLVFLRLALLVTGLGPVPENFSRLALGVYRSMTGVAGDGLGVFVEMMVQQAVAGVRIIAVTGLAAETAFGHRHRCASAGDFMIARAVAFRALEVVAAHMDIAASIGGKQLPGKFRMLDGLSSAAVEMAVTTCLAAGGAYALGHFDKVYFGVRHPGVGRRFCIGSGPIVADQAIDFCLVGKIKGFVSPSVSRVAACATSLVAVYAHSEIIYGCCGFAMVNVLGTVQGVR